MKRVIEADFFPREPDASQQDVVGDSTINEKRRVLVVDKDGGEVAARIESDPIQRSNGLAT